MDKLDKTRVVLRSLDSFQALRSALTYLRSISVVFESGKAGGHIEAIEEQIKATVPEQLTETQLGLLSTCCSHAAICTHMALLYTAVCSYEALVKVNPLLRYDKLDKELEAAKRNDLLDSMRKVRNAVFHVRPSTRSEQLILDIVRLSTENKLEWNKLENLLFDATERVFRSPETLFQEKKEVLEEGFRRALAYYEEHLADRCE